LLSPVAGLTLHDLIFDGSSVAQIGLYLTDIVNSAVTNVTGRNVTNGVAGAIRSEVAYGITWTNLEVTNSGGGSGAAVTFYRQGHLTVNGASLHNLAPGAFGFIPFAMADGTFSNITVDAAGTGGGRPLKMNGAAYNTWDNLTVNNAEGNYHGISIVYYSQHNIFNNCNARNNSGGGIFLFDNSGAPQGGQAINSFNKFNNCTVTQNPGGFPEFIIGVGSNSTEINGGTYTGMPARPVIGMNVGSADGTYIHGAIINGPGTAGISLSGNNSCINDNSFGAGTSLSASISVSGSNNLGTGNTLNGLNSNLTSGSCGTSQAGTPPPAPPSGLTATVQ
jgi:hypothetical protein